jgi:hypothetical protein
MRKLAAGRVVMSSNQKGLFGGFAERDCVRWPAPRMLIFLPGG